MLAILQFVFQDFWHWLGSAVLLAILTLWTPICIKRKDN